MKMHEMIHRSEPFFKGFCSKESKKLFLDFITDSRLKRMPDGVTFGESIRFHSYWGCYWEGKELLMALPTDGCTRLVFNENESFDRFTKGFSFEEAIDYANERLGEI